MRKYDGGDGFKEERESVGDGVLRRLLPQYWLVTSTLVLDGNRCVTTRLWKFLANARQFPEPKIVPYTNFRKIESGDRCEARRRAKKGRERF